MAFIKASSYNYYLIFVITRSESRESSTNFNGVLRSSLTKLCDSIYTITPHYTDGTLGLFLVQQLFIMSLGICYEEQKTSARAS